MYEAKLKRAVGGDEIKVDLNDRNNGTYLAEYTVDKLYGKLTLSVCLRGAHIKGSPFVVNVAPLRNVEKPNPSCEEIMGNYGTRCEKGFFY